MNKILKGEELPVFGDGEQTRAFSYISDVAKPIANSIFIKDAYNEIFNIGADKPYTINMLIKEISRIFNIKPKIRYLPKRKEVKHAFSDHTKANEYFKEYMEKIDLQEGLVRMSDWVRTVGIKESEKFKNIEVMKNLPEFWLE